MIGRTDQDVWRPVCVDVPYLDDPRQHGLWTEDLLGRLFKRLALALVEEYLAERRLARMIVFAAVGKEHVHASVTIDIC